MSHYAITVFGQDRPGIIAEITGALARTGLNIEDSTMTLLRGHFAMMLITDGSADRGAVGDALTGLITDVDLSVSVSYDVAPVESDAATGSPYLLSVHGGDRPGIVSALLAQVAAVGGNVTDLSTRLIGELYVLSAECSLPTGTDVDALDTAVRRVAGDLGVSASLLPMDSDDL